MESLLFFALPVFGLLIVAEWLYGRRIGRNTYRLGDGIGSLSQGVLSQAIAACTQLFQIGLYAWFHRRFSVGPGAAIWSTLAGWLLAVLLFDFCDYWLHRAGHEVAVFWGAHAVHHQSEDFNFTTALRQESFVAILGWPFYLPMAWLGVPPAQFAAAGMVVLLYQFWIHTEHIGKLGWFDRVFSSPSNHRVHHAINPGYINKNYGGMLVIWDRLFGTFAEEREPCVYGTLAPLATFDPLRALTQVYAALLRDARHTRRWRDKLRVWFMPTGWRPADVAERWPAPPSRLDGVARHDVVIGRREQWCAAIGFAVAALCTLGLLADLDALHSWPRTAAAAGAIAALLWVVGAILERALRPGAALALGLACVVVVVGALGPVTLATAGIRPPPHDREARAADGGSAPHAGPRSPSRSPGPAPRPA